MSTSPHAVTGIHHVTAIAGDPQENVDFYAGLLGMRFVKRSVNQDDPSTYHLFYADGEGHPGSDLTFFPWPRGAAGHTGSGLVNEVALAVPPGSLGYWRERLSKHGVKMRSGGDLFGEAQLHFFDPHALKLSLVESQAALDRTFTPWENSTVPEGHQIRGIHAVRSVATRKEASATFVGGPLGMRQVATDGVWTRYAGTDATSGYFEVREDASAHRGMWGVGTVHHVAWRVRDDEHQLAVREEVAKARVSPTQVIDRFWFHSVYFREPGGVLFELATDGPGFAIDEPLASLGETLVLPPWLEPQREEIEANLPPLTLPHLKKEAPPA